LFLAEVKFILTNTIMYRNYFKVPLSALLIVSCLFFQSCKDEEAVAPQEDEVIANDDVLRKIKSLGFADNQIKEMPDYYLADGDLYFSKKISGDATTAGKTTKRRVLEKYPTLTIHLDESLAAVIDEHWRAGIDQAIAEWNADEQVHFHFKLTSSTDANINIIEDTDLPGDLAIAAEFPRNGRTGSAIRVNVTATKAITDPKHAVAHALAHCLGFRHSTFMKNEDVTVKSNAKTAGQPRYIWELYAIQDDVLYRIDAITGQYFPVHRGWAGTEVMGQLNGMLYMVQFGTLWAVDPGTGDFEPLTDGWEGSQYITSLSSENKLFIMQDSWIWPVDPETGWWDPSLGSYTLPRGMVAITDTDNNNKLAVLRRKPGSSTTCVFYVINSTNGAVHSSTTIKASGVADWNKTFLLTGDPFDTKSVVVFNGKINFADVNNVGGYSYYEDSYWPDAELATCIGLDVFLINKGTLYRADWFSNKVPHPMLGVNGAKRLGKYNTWTNTSSLVFLE